MTREPDEECTPPGRLVPHSRDPVLAFNSRSHHNESTLCGRVRVYNRCLCENQCVEKYVVVIHEEAEGGFWAEVPALPGCYSQGESVDELMANVREAITGVLEVMKEQGTRPEANIRILDLAV